MAQLPRLLIIMGAGASVDAWNGEGEPIEARKPSVARDLFVNVDRQREEIAHRYPGVELIRHVLRGRPQEGFDLEHELSVLRNHENPMLRSAFYDVPRYLRELILYFQDYVVSPGTHVMLLNAVLNEHPHETLVVSLNYDNFVERAISTISLGSVRFDDFDSYIDNGYAPNVQVIKPHGSANWFRAVAYRRTPAPTPEFIHALTQSGSLFNESETVVCDLPPDSRAEQLHGMLPRSTDEAHWLYPLMTAPLSEKSSASLVCPPSHISAMVDFLSKGISKVLVIGTSGQDAHVLRLISDALGTRYANHLLPAAVVAQNHAQAQVATANLRRYGALDHLVAMRENGFAEFVRSEAFREFVNADDDPSPWFMRAQTYESRRTKSAVRRPLSRRAV